MKTAAKFACLVALLLAAQSAARGATITQWNFNNGSATTTPNIGAGTASTVNTTSTAPTVTLTWLSGAPASPVVGTGSPGDTSGGGQTNAGLAIGGLPTQATPSNTKGLQFATSTAGNTNIEVRFDLVDLKFSSRYFQLQATSDGTNYSNVSGGIGINPTTLGAAASPLTTGVSAATIDNTGLISITSSLLTTDFNSSNNKFANGTTGAGSNSTWTYGFKYDFAAGSAYENNPNFGFRIVVANAPSTTSYVASVDGTAASYLNSGANTGWRIDNVTVSSVPEPSSLALGLCAALGLFALRRRIGK